MKISDLFRDNNSINEKNIVGFSSFTIMVIFAIADILSAFLGRDLQINDVIFNSFVIVTLGSFGIDGVTKIFNRNKKEEVEDEAE